MKVQIMIVPGPIANVEIPVGRTVLQACEKANEITSHDFVGLAGQKEVRVQNRKFSSTTKIPEGYSGSICSTPLNDGDVILIIQKIEGNDGVGIGALTCKVNDDEYALETPGEAQDILPTLGFSLENVSSFKINGETALLNQLIGLGDVVSITYSTEVSADDEDVDSVIFGHLGGEVKNVDIKDVYTIAELLEAHGNPDSLSNPHAVFHNGNVETDVETEIEVGDSIIVVPTTKTGTRVNYVL